MADNFAIRAEALGKRYVIGHKARSESYVALRDVVARGAQRLLRTSADIIRGRGDFAGEILEDFWALRHLDFKINRGEVVGIIGRNGAGKSTLLKILSRITEPSEGRVTINGSVASLLEVGTGFHPELTGRENIYLNGAILGMKRSEIRRKFDQIVDFSGVEKFLDTPVKRFSSGMYVRLAFAVAAYLESDILIVDEVLAVGDAEFQKKCLGKMGEIASEGGRAVLFVSHQLGMISQLCSKGILLSDGEMTFSGPAREAIEHYVSSGTTASGGIQLRPGFLEQAEAAITSVATLAANGEPVDDFAWDSPVIVQVKVVLNKSIRSLHLGIGIDNPHSVRVTTWVARISDYIAADFGEVAFTLKISPKIIAPGSYKLTVALFELGGEVHHLLEGICSLVLHDSGSNMAAFGQVNYGVVIVPGEWSVGRPT